jgi:hypothetical protein
MGHTGASGFPVARFDIGSWFAHSKAPIDKIPQPITMASVRACGQ